MTKLADGAAKKQALELGCNYEKKIIRRLSLLMEQIDQACEDLEIQTGKLGLISDVTELAFTIRDEILPRMSTLRAPADEAETLTAAEDWPFPAYGELLFGV